MWRDQRRIRRSADRNKNGKAAQRESESPDPRLIYVLVKRPGTGRIGDKTGKLTWAKT